MTQRKIATELTLIINQLKFLSLSDYGCINACLTMIEKHCLFIDDIDWIESYIEIVSVEDFAPFLIITFMCDDANCCQLSVEPDGSGLLRSGFHNQQPDIGLQFEFDVNVCDERFSKLFTETVSEAMNDEVFRNLFPETVNDYHPPKEKGKTDDDEKIHSAWC